VFLLVGADRIWGQVRLGFTQARTSDNRTGRTIDERAREAYLEGDYRQAIRLWSQAIRKSDAKDDLLVKRGLAYELMERPRRAIADYRRTLKLNPVHRQAMLRLAPLLERSGKDLAEAVLLYRSARLLTTEQAERDRLAFCQAVLERRLAGRSDSAVDLWHQAHRLIGRRKLERAIRCLDHALEVDPTMHQALFTRGIVQEMQGRHRLALQSIERGLQLSPQYPGGWILRGRTAEAVGEKDKAFQSYRKAEQWQPYDPAGHYHVARLLFASQDLEAAWSRCLMSLEDNPRGPLKTKLRSLMNKIAQRDPSVPERAKRGETKRARLPGLW
jgi:tetratricopeptide (TPR) repeat protein